MSTARTLWPAALAATFMQAALPAAAKPIFTPIDPPGSGATMPTSINSAGTVAGHYADQSSVTHGFIRSAGGSFTVVDPPGSTETEILGMNDAGSTVGRFRNAAGIHCFVRDPAGAFTVFNGCSGGQDCHVVGINAKGEIVGYEFDNMGVAAAFLRTPNGTIKALKGVSGSSEATAINDAGVAAGFMVTNSQSPGFVRDRNGRVTTFDAPGDVNGTFPQSINADGAIAGYFADRSGAEHSFVRAPDGEIIAFDPPGSQVSEATGINARGEVTGIYDGAGFLGFTRSATGKFQSFAAPDGTTGTFPHGINGHGAIIGYYVDGQDAEHGFIRTP